MSPLSVLFLLPALLAGCALLAHGLAHRPDDTRPRSEVARRRDAAGRDAGMSTAEYAVGTVAAVAFAGVLYAVVSSSATHEMIMSVVRRALTLPF
ncbi:DUF4244 domain-containing protein [Pseudofrankia asymbiotica]|uniref:DUF4244 domain-containing protein n=1 Tax=Pseudofrankia asymbiotica TaxID=1834516 RepID=A0A1V2I5K3_9ACTN|nr:DUF4244 domain-containing protein [Pseudofrankia asymbiotica]ONH26240.1 hypothetical protein BL253_25240 [Pseudofrankia asymbiotica]